MIKQRISTSQLILCGIATILFISLLFGIQTNATWIQAFDTHIISFVRQLSPGKTAFFKLYTVFFNTLPIMILVTISVVILVIYKFYRAAFFFFCVSFFGSVINVGIKNLVDRMRPQTNQLIHYSGFSFPSGHSVIATLVFGSLIIFIQHSPLPRYLKWVVIFMLVLAILLVGISRIYIGVHYPSDVLAGFCLGFITLTIGQILFNIRKVSL